MTQPTHAGPQAGTIHDLAYKPYTGRRTHPMGRFEVIARYAMLFQLRQRSVKVLLILGLFSLVACGAILAGESYFLGRMEGVRDHNVLASLAMRSESLVSFLLVLVCGAPALAADLNAGAFQFHFARPVAIGQYLFGRVVSAGGFALGLSLVSLMALATERMALVGDPRAVLAVTAKVALALALRVLTYASVALGLSSLTRRRGLAQAMFAGVVVFSWTLARLLSLDMDVAWVRGASVGGAADMVCDQLLGQTHLHGWQAAAPGASALGWIGLSLALAAWRLSRAEVVRG